MPKIGRSFKKGRQKKANTASRSTSVAGEGGVAVAVNNPTTTTTGAVITPRKRKDSPAEDSRDSTANKRSNRNESGTLSRRERSKVGESLKKTLQDTTITASGLASKMAHAMMANFTDEEDRAEAVKAFADTMEIEAPAATETPATATPVRTPVANRAPFVTPKEPIENPVNFNKYAFEVGLDDGTSLSLIHVSEPTRLGMISYAVFCLKKKNKKN